MDNRERLEEMRRQAVLKPPRRRGRPVGLMGGGGSPLYIAVMVAFTGFTIYTTYIAFVRGLYLPAGLGLLISVGMLTLMYYIIRARS